MVEDRPAQDGPHINGKHIKGDSQSSYDVDVWMSPYCVIGSLVGLAFGRYLEFWVPPEGQRLGECAC